MNPWPLEKYTRALPLCYLPIDFKLNWVGHKCLSIIMNMVFCTIIINDLLVLSVAYPYHGCNWKWCFKILIVGNECQLQMLLWQTNWCIWEDLFLVQLPLFCLKTICLKKKEERNAFEMIGCNMKHMKGLGCVVS